MIDLFILKMSIGYIIKLDFLVLVYLIFICWKLVFKFCYLYSFIVGWSGYSLF